MLLYLSMLDTQEEKDKFTEIYQQYQHFCWYVANQLLGDAHLAEDAVQDAFLALTRHLDKIEDVESPRTRKFLLTIVKSKAVDILRRQHGEISVDELDREPADPEADVLGAYITKENYNHLISCILELEEAYRVIFEYKYVHQLSDKEIAQLLDITPGSVSVLGLMNDHENRVRLLIDRDVLESHEFLGCHPCINTSSLKLRTRDLLETILPAIHHQYTVVDLPNE